MELVRLLRFVAIESIDAANIRIFAGAIGPLSKQHMFGCFHPIALVVGIVCRTTVIAPTYQSIDASAFFCEEECEKKKNNYSIYNTFFRSEYFL